ncbi:monooxygenase 2-like isoform X2 [Tasmannia lanceolata]|uniref:monooxygenase 2-like isoform X2 n=1 Tax=Tasmannia lanceolata TaxID=3420 RepID=UPI004063A7F9
MEVIADIVIVGAGIAGLATSLGLHRMGLQSLVLESSESLRTTGFSFLTWTNAWKALDALGIGDSLRQQHIKLQGLVAVSMPSGVTTAQMSFKASGKCGEHEVRCVRRKLLLETLVRELPPGTVRFGSKVVSIEEAGNLKLVHLADGSILKAKVLIGSDGVNSVVAKWLGLQTPTFMPRWAIRGFTEFSDSSHGFPPEFLQYFGDGFRSGFLPCDKKTIYWFFTYSPSPQEKCKEQSEAHLKECVLSKLGNVPQEVLNVVKNSKLNSVFSSPLRLRWPGHVLWGNICKGNVCLAGDALHPMTPDLAQGACSSLEDGVILARCLGESFMKKPIGILKEEEYNRIKRGLEKYTKDRRWRSIELITASYFQGSIQQSAGKPMNYLRDRMSMIMAEMLLKKADFDCGKLFIP